MSTEQNLPSSAATYAELLQMTLLACELAQQSSAAASDALAGKSPAALATIANCERKLDLLDRELDERVAYAVTLVDVADARELRGCSYQSAHSI